MEEGRSVEEDVAAPPPPQQQVAPAQALDIGLPADQVFSDETRYKVQHHIFKQKLEKFAQDAGIAQFGEQDKPSCFICHAWEEGGAPLDHFCVRLSRLLHASGIEAVTATEHNTYESLVRFAEGQFRKCDTHPNHKILFVGSRELITKNDTPGSIVRFEVDAIDALMSRDESKVVLVLQDGTEQDSFPVRFHRKPYVDFRDTDSQSPLNYGGLEYVQRFLQLMGRFVGERGGMTDRFKALELEMQHVIESFSWSEENQALLRQIEEREREVQEQLRQRGQESALQAMQSLLQGQEASQDFFLAKN